MAFVDTVELPDGTPMPRFGMGTWFLGESAAKHDDELAALRTGLDAGVTLIDTAEMYGSGAAERLAGEAIRGYDRESLFLVSKVYPHNAGDPEIFESVEASLERLGTDYLDLYLLHWRGSIPLAETVECMEQLVGDGLIRHWGVSNFDVDDLEELFAVPDGERCAVNQDLYHLGSRGVEYAVLPWMRSVGMPLMAYCPLAQAGDLRRGLTNDPAVVEVARRHDATPLQILLAFVLRDPMAIAIPRSGKPEHVLENVHACEIELSDDDLALLSRSFPAPGYPTPLDIV
ncbi:aldo/keto reductase [Enorma sp.]|uniref:aldo/keto reductase n=1 Tax=Enorma sp. TaxID=1920692 RepID=UPI003AB67884